MKTAIAVVLSLSAAGCASYNEAKMPAQGKLVCEDIYSKDKGWIEYCQDGDYAEIREYSTSPHERRIRQ